MKIIAITPDYFKVNDLLNSIRLLEKNRASHLYLRSPFILSSRHLKDICENLKEFGFKVILPLEQWLKFKDKTIICHFKEKDLNKIDNINSLFSDISFSASVHSIENVELIISKGAEFVFISPIFKPFSKKDYSLQPIDLNEVSKLIEKFGEKVVLLGGIDFERVERLKLEMKNDFSIAGITMFFGGKGKS